MRSSPRASSCYGFTLLEMSLVLLIVALLAASILTGATVDTHQEKYAEMEARLDRIEAALISFRKRNDRIPCPGDLATLPTAAAYGVEAANLGACTGGAPAANYSDNNSVGGSLPAKTLGLSDADMYDPWGGKILYAVDARLTAANAFSSLYPVTDTTIGDITVLDTGGNTVTANAAIVLLSHGPNGHGAYQESGVASAANATNASELDNCDCDAAGASTGFTRQFIQGPYYTNPADLYDRFDDVLRYYFRWHLRVPSDET